MIERKKYKIRVEIIRDELARIIASSTFKRSKKSGALLSFLIDRENRGKGHELKLTTIALDFFNLGFDMDDADESKIRMQLGRLRQRLSLYYQTEGSGSSIIIELPNGSYRPISSIRKDVEETEDQIQNEVELGILYYPIESKNADLELVRYFNNTFLQTLRKFKRFNRIKKIDIKEFPDKNDTSILRKSENDIFYIEGELISLNDSKALQINIWDIKSDNIIWGDSFRLDTEDSIESLDLISSKLISHLTSNYSRFSRSLDNVSNLDMRSKFFSLFDKYNRSYSPESFSEFIKYSASVLNQNRNDYLISSMLAEVYLNEYFLSDYLDDKYFRIAEKLVLESLEENDFDVNVCWSAGLYYYLINDKDKSRYYFKRCVELNPKDAIYLNAVAIMYYFLGQQDVSFKLMEEAKSMTNLLQPFSCLVRCVDSIVHDDFQKAEKHLLNFNIYSNYLYHLLNAIVVFNLGSKVEALKCYNKVLLLRPNFLSQRVVMIEKVFFDKSISALLLNYVDQLIEENNINT